MTEQASLRKLDVSNWRQFGSASIEFHERLTIITGANASGKSTLLSILAKHFNWPRSYSSAPRHRREEFSDETKGPNERDSLWEDYSSLPLSNFAASWRRVGQLEYGSGIVTEIVVPPADQASRLQYDLHLPGQQSIDGVNLNSHRSTAGAYSAVSSLPTIFFSPQEILNQFTGEVRNRWAGSYSAKTPAAVLKESLLAAAVFGESNSSSVDANSVAHDIWVGFQGVLRQLLPPTLGFIRLRARVPDLIIETKTGDFVIDESSGGVSAIIEIGWQIFLAQRSRTSSNTFHFVVLFDEPENHLHPSLQRTLVPALLSAFPQVQFVMATHSPFIVTATPDSRVYALEYDAENRVKSRELDYANKAASAQETLTRVLGVESTLPVWAEDRYAEIVRKYADFEENGADLSKMREEMVNSGLVNEFPLALAALARRARGASA
jgi:predicted ATPase